jgi:hypothetical protein
MGVFTMAGVVDEVGEAEDIFNPLELARSLSAKFNGCFARLCRPLSALSNYFSYGMEALVRGPLAQLGIIQGARPPRQ